MYTQGVTDVQIGLILSITMFVQVFFSFFGGILADKLGRKFTTMLGDFFGWAVACLVWSVSNNFWLFLAAALLNCFEQINQTAWYCLLIEDAQPKDLIGIYTWVNIGGLVAIFFAPLSGLFVNDYSVVPVVRVLYFLFALTMLTKCFITFKFCRETKQGQVRRAETKGVSIFHMVGEYRHLIPRLLQDKAVLKAVAVSVILYITNMVNTNFFSLYVHPAAGPLGEFPGPVPHFKRRCDAGIHGGHPAPAERHQVPRPPVDRPGAVRRCRFGAHLLPGGQPGLCAYLRVCGRGGSLSGEPPQGTPCSS